MACHSNHVPSSSQSSPLNPNLQQKDSYQEVLTRRSPPLPLRDVNPNTVANIPNDYLDWSGVGFSKEYLENIKRQEREASLVLQIEALLSSGNNVANVQLPPYGSQQLYQHNMEYMQHLHNSQGGSEELLPRLETQFQREQVFGQGTTSIDSRKGEQVRRMDMERQARMLFQKSIYCRRAVMLGVQLEKKQILDSKDALLRLHQSLALFCARATPRSADAGAKYVVETEVVACHIEFSTAQQKLPLQLAKNTAWERDDRTYVVSLLEHFERIGQCTVDNVFSKGDLPGLQMLIYGYCKDKVWSRLGKLLVAMKALSQLPQAIRDSQKMLEIYLQQYEAETNALSFRLSKLADASNHCRKYPMSSDNAGAFPLMVKRWNKVASYSASFNNVVTWALGVNSYAKYKGKFLDQKQVTYYTPVTRNIDDFTKTTLDGHFSPAYKTKDDAERKRKIAALTPIGAAAKDRDEVIFVHAEMHMAPLLAHQNLKEDQYIGISKPCCFLCSKAIQSLQGPSKIVVRGTHGKLYPKWMIPQTSPSNKITMQEAELRSLETALDEAIVNEIFGNTYFPPTADSIWNSENTDDFNAQPS